MKYLMQLLVLIVCATVIVTAGVAQNKYVGVKTCAPCHKAEKVGSQFGIWQKTAHAEAFKALTTPKAAEVAKGKGITTPASETPECLECHAIKAEAAQMDKFFDVKDGVQCETCHGPGSAYKSMAVMKDKAKSVAAGLIEYKDDAAIQKKCESCHNKKSPTYKDFKFAEFWPKIKHAVPK